MATGVHLSQSRKMQSHSQKNKEKNLVITASHYVQDFSLAFTFNTGECRIVDFLHLFQKHVKGNNLIYFAPNRFKKFIVKNGNIYWGRNEDVIFPVQFLYSGSLNKEQDDEKNSFYHLICDR